MGFVGNTPFDVIILEFQSCAAERAYITTELFNALLIVVDEDPGNFFVPRSG